MRKFLTFLVICFLTFSSVTNLFAQGTTTSGLNGKVLDDQMLPLPGANVVVTHVPTGAVYGTITDNTGFYRLPNLNVGGPYKVEISFVGFELFAKENVYLSLGQTFRVDAKMSAVSSEIVEVVVTARRNDMFDGNRTGAETVVDENTINSLPTLSRSMTDFVRLTPQASVDDYGGISIAGINNRYNAISIDGAVNNDVFGLSSSGTNGGQTGGTPISMDAIEQFQVVLAPYDVRQSGFAGASINAVTRRGTNEFEGSAYYLLRNQNMAGLTPTDDEDLEREKLDEFASTTYGFRLGGPIIKNKLFFFVSGEILREETPQPFDATTYTGDSDAAALEALNNKLSDLGWEAGGYENNTKTLNSDKVLLRLDYNLSQKHKLSLRHSFTYNEATLPGRSSSRTINFFNAGQYFPSTTNSTTLELNSNLNKMANSLIVGYITVRDDRDPMGGNFPALIIRDGDGTIYAGSEAFSTANQLDQDIFSITDNLSYYLGNHTLTVGVNAEFSHSYNLFVRQNYGEYTYSSLDDFLAVGTADEVSAYQIARSYSLVDDVTGDGSAAAADFNMMQIGFYAQDEMQLSEKLKVTFGIRFDVPIFSTQPEEDTYFNTTTIPLLEAAGWDLQGAKAGQMPKSAIMPSPRLGFNYDVLGDKSIQIRGGVGIFTSRLPLVWPGGSYTNNGLTIGGIYYRNSNGYEIPFVADWENQPTASDFGNTDKIPSGQMDLFVSDFKFPQVFRVNLAIDKKLPYDMVFTLEGMYSKTFNNVNYYNLNIAKDPTGNITGGNDTRPFYSNTSLDPTYTRIILGTNTNEGYTYNITAQLQKLFSRGFSASVAYTFGEAKAINDATSSQNSSQYRYMEQVNGLNNLELSYSDFDMGHRVVAYASYKFDWLNAASTTISLVYNIRSGERFSYIYNDAGVLNGLREGDNNLIYIPKDASDINLVEYVSNGTTYTPEYQWQLLEQYIDNDPYLSEHKGEYAERNGARLPYEHIVDLRIAQDFFLTVAGKKHTLQFTFDVFNFTNMASADLGRRYFTGNDYIRLIKFTGFEEDGTTPKFNFAWPGSQPWSIDDSGTTSSRWQGQFGVRYIF